MKATITTLLATSVAAASQIKPKAISFTDRCTESVIASASNDFTVEKVAYVAAGEEYGEGAGDLGFPDTPTDLPELCAVTVRVNSSETSSYRFGIFLPAEWNERMITSGNGGFAGGINWLDMGAGVKYGFASISTDTGHNSTLSDGSWALNNEEARLDFGYRSIHGSVEHSKVIVKTFYEQDIRYSYYSACSTGGRQGIRETQSYPDSFDGVLIGAPAWWTTRLQSWTLQKGLKNGKLVGDARITTDLFSVIRQNVVSQCDAPDGVEDGIISDAYNCKIDYDLLTCGKGNVSSTECLTEAQIGTLKEIYSPWIIDGKWTFPGMNPGSEDLFVVLFGGLEPQGLGTSYLTDFVLNNASWAPENWNDNMLAGIDAMDPGKAVAGNFTGVTNFRDRGGKIILYHGQADSMIPPGSSEYLYNHTAEGIGEDLNQMREWFRLFRIPGMGHCSNTYVGAPWYIASGNQAGAINSSLHSVPGFEDKKHDVLLALMDWVENGTAVDSVIATTWNNATDPSSGVLRQRPLCAVPYAAKLKESANEKVAENWTCE